MMNKENNKEMSKTNQVIEFPEITEESMIAKLNQPLQAAKVKTRSQSGTSLSYVSGFHVIDQSNQIFGHFNWDRITSSMQLVQQETKAGKTAGTENNYVGYICTVIVNVNGVTRYGTGFGQGIDRDLGKAHESAVKEAETDATKRALMTFGYVFGLALYDADKENVIDVRVEPAVQKAVTAKLAEIGISEMDAMIQWDANGYSRITKENAKDALAILIL